VQVETLGALEEILIRVDLERPSFTSDHLRRMPNSEWRSILDSALVVETELAAAVECDGCFEGHDADVHFAPAVGGTPPRPYVVCPESGVTWIERERLRQWSVDVPQLVERLARALGCSGRTEELVPGRLWLLGRVSAKGGVRELFFGRALAARDGASVLAGCPRFRAAVAPSVLVAGALPRTDGWPDPRPTFVAVSSLLAFENGSFAADRAYLLAALGGLPQEATKAAAAPAADACVFRRQGTTWLVVFEGVARTVEDSVGMRYVAELLRTPHVEVHSVRLRDLVAGEPTRAVGSAGEVLDREALRQIKERLDANREEEDEAREHQDFARVERLQEEAESLRREVARATGLGGRHRRAADDRERARQAVAQAIRRALAAIAREHEYLSRHLERTLRLGAVLVYEPDLTRTWET
jgi:hypothetical protein